MSDIKQQVAEMIKKARTAKGLTLKELGQKVGVSESTAAHYEAGRQNLTIETLTKIASALDLKFSPKFE
jgi:UDP-N-acetylglucosamine 1-carboxyvinyltransferase